MPSSKSLLISLSCFFDAYQPLRPAAISSCKLGTAGLRRCSRPPLRPANAAFLRRRRRLSSGAWEQGVRELQQLEGLCVASVLAVGNDYN